MDVLLLVSLVGAKSYAPGDRYPCASEAEAKSLIAAGYAEAIDELPSDKPKRAPRTK